MARLLIISLFIAWGDGDQQKSETDRNARQIHFNRLVDAAYSEAISLKTSDSKSKFLRRTALTQIALLQAKSGQLKAALRSAELLDDPKESLAAFNAHLHLAAGDVEKAVEMRPNDFAVLTAAASHYARQKKPDEAIRLVQRLKQARARDRLLLSIAEAQLSIGDHRAASITTGMIKDFEDEQKSRVARRQATSGDISGALKTVALINSQSWKDETLPYIAEAQAKQGKLKAAENTASSIESGYYRPLGFALVAIVQVKSNNLSGARRNVERAVRSARDSPRTQYWRNVALAQAAVGDVTGALKSVQQIDNAVVRPRCVAEIVEVQLGRGQMTAALKTAALITETEAMVRVLISIAAYQFSKGEASKARERIQQAIKSADGDVMLLQTIAYQQSKAGDSQKVEEWIKIRPRAIERVWALLGAARGILKPRGAN